MKKAHFGTKDGRVPKGYWQNKENQRKLFNNIAEKLNIRTQEDWYSISRRQLTQYGGETLLRLYYNNSLYSALKSIYPMYSWSRLMCINVPHNFWTKKSNRREYFDWISQQLGIEKQEDWYNYSGTYIRSLFKAGPLNGDYSTSLTKSLQETYPEFTWFEWKFNRIPIHFWDDEENQKKCFELVANELNINSLTEWMDITKREVIRAGGKSLLLFHGSLWNALIALYRNVDWSEALQLHAGQQHATSLLKSLLPNDQLFVNYTPKGTRIEFDIYIPSLSLALEYQGGLHYDKRFYQGNINDRIHSLQEKRAYCEQTGITLIEIPYWWGNSIDTLTSTIHAKRPDIQFKLTKRLPLLESRSKIAFPHNLTVSEFQELVKSNEFQQIFSDNVITFDNDARFLNSFPDPETATTAKERRLFQLRRGIKFCKKTGVLLARPFHKFWNLSSSASLDLSSIEVILYKYDGVMITPVIDHNDQISFESRRSSPWIAASIHQKILQQKPEYEKFSRKMIAQDLTPIFEYCGPSVKKFVTYAEEFLILISIRHNNTGEYMEYNRMCEVAAVNNIPVAQAWDGQMTDWQQLRELLCSMHNCEGFVIKCKDDNLYKLKTTWWLERYHAAHHSAKRKPNFTATVEHLM